MTDFLLISLLTTLLPTSEPIEAERVDSLRQVQLDEVNVVTTIKENGQMRQQPWAVTLIGKGQLTDHHVTSLKGAGVLVPNLFMPDYGSRMTSAIYIRGIGSRINTPAVGLYVDNIPYIDKSAFDFNFYDIERVDVMRGPQGTLYGRNTMGGLVRVYTKNPFSYEGTDLKLGYATGDNHRSLSLTHYHHVNDHLAFAGGGYYEGGDGFFRNSTTGEKADNIESGGGRIRGIFKPSDQLSLDFNLSYDYSEEGAYPYFYTGSLTDSEDYQPLVGQISNNRKHTYRRGLLNAGLNIEYKANGWQLNAVTGYQDINDRMLMDQDFIAPDIYTLEQRQRIHTLNEEIILKNTDQQSRWQWISGMNLMYQWLDTEGPVTFYQDGLDWLAGNINAMMPSIDKIPMLQRMGFGDMGIAFRGNQLLMSGSYHTPTMGAALFHQSTFRLTDQLSATLGLRLDYEHQQMDYDSPAHVDYAFTLPNRVNDKMSVSLQDLVSDVRYEGSLSHDRFRLLPKFALQYDFSPSSNLYASVAMGQRSGGYNLQMFSDLLQGSMRVNMMEGVKEGVGNYLDYLTANTPGMPKQLPDPENPGQMISLADYVRRAMAQNMPQLQVPSTQQVVYKPEYSWNFELGSHLTLTDCMLTLDAALFYNRIFDQQIARFAPSGLGRMMVNASQSQNYGGELSARWLPDSHLAFTGNYGYTHATFLDYDDGNHDYSDNYVPFVPMHTLNLDAAYTWHFSDGTGLLGIRALTLGADCTGTGRIYWTESNSVSQPFYTTLGARLTLECQQLTVNLWGKNLTDERYNTFYFESASRGFEQHGKPLQVGIDLSLHF